MQTVVADREAGHGVASGVHRDEHTVVGGLGERTLRRERIDGSTDLLAAPASCAEGADRRERAIGSPIEGLDAVARAAVQLDEHGTVTRPLVR